MQSADGRFVVSFNGEIYNHADIRRELETHGCSFRSRSDTEVLLQAWQLWGEESLGRLRGMFAFAIWDGRDRTLWLARDRLGEKPLYYSLTDTRLLFASEMRSLLASGAVDRRIDSDGLDSYLAFGSVTQPLTLIRNVRCVEPGHFVRYRNDQLTDHRYWSIEDVRQAAPDSSEHLRESVERVLDEAVGLCMVSDVPVGVLLSGGVDSTAILSRLRRLGYDDLRTFSVLFDASEGDEYSEEKWSDRAAARFGTRHTKVRIGRQDGFGQLDAALDSMDQPSYDGFNHFIVMRAVAREGLKVAITGQGADELFWGYGRHRMYRWLVRCATVSLPQQLLRAAHSASRTMAFNNPNAAKLVSVFEAGDPHVLAYMTRHLIFSTQAASRLRSRKTLPQARFVQQWGGADDLDILYRLELNHFLRNTLLRDGDQMSMANSLELRGPFLDYRLVELLLSVPSRWKAVAGRQKPLLVDAVRDDLVAAISRRPKVNFAIPLGSWLREGYGRALLEEETELFDRKEIARVRASFEAGEPYRKLWTLCVLLAWMKRVGVSPPSN